MSAMKRRYPRVACDVPAELTIDQAKTIPVAIRSLTCEGMGLLIGDPMTDSPALESTVTVRLSAFGREVVLSGHVVWFDPLRTGEPVNLGIHIDDEPKDPDVANAWADWVVSRISQQHGAAPEVTAWHQRLSTTPP